MTPYFVLKFFHIIGATVLLGTGAGIAFFMAMAHRTGSLVVIAATARTLVIADFAFTASAVVAQPITGFWLASEMGYPTREAWIVASIILYLVAGAFWLPVISIQSRMRHLCEQALKRGETELPAEYRRAFRTWVAFGFPAFAAVLVILWLMTTRPTSFF